MRRIFVVDAVRSRMMETSGQQLSKKMTIEC
jgi:hypothetical protein